MREVNMSDQSVRDEFRAQCEAEGMDFKKKNFDAYFDKMFSKWLTSDNRQSKPEEFKGYITLREDSVETNQNLTNKR